jgi:pre-mRNA-splicing factor SYF1
MFAQLEEEHGLAKRAMAIYDRATKAVKADDKFEVCPTDHSLARSNPLFADLCHFSRRCCRYLCSFILLCSQMFTIYIAKATANFGRPATRPIYQRAIEVLPDSQTAQMCLRFANLERKLGEIDRARAIYAHASQFCDPRVNPAFWSEWNACECILLSIRTRYDGRM